MHCPIYILLIPPLVLCMGKYWNFGCQATTNRSTYDYCICTALCIYIKQIMLLKCTCIDDRSSSTATSARPTRPSTQLPVTNDNVNQFNPQSGSISATAAYSVMGTIAGLIVIVTAIIVVLIVLVVGKTYHRRKTIQQPASTTSRPTQLLYSPSPCHDSLSSTTP